MGAVLLTGLFMFLMHSRGVMGATYDAATGKYKGCLEHDYGVAVTTTEAEIFEKCTRCSQQNLLRKIPRIKKFELSHTSLIYNGKTRTPSVLIEDAEGRVLSPSEYKVYYDKGRKNVGEYQVRVALQGYYEGGEILAFTIKPKTASISKITAGSKKLTITWKRLELYFQIYYHYFVF